MRLILSMVLGLFVTFGLFYLMANLISQGKKEITKPSDNVSIDFVRIKRSSETETRRRELPQKPPLPQKAPPVPKMNIAQDQSPQQAPEQLNLEMPNMDLGLAGGSGPYLARGNAGQARSNADETPLVRIDPEYPINARMKGIEGFVKVSFNISRDGSPADIEIEDSNPPRVFDRAVRKAVMRWKYKPRIKDGKAIDSPDRLLVHFPFKLEDE